MSLRLHSGRRGALQRALIRHLPGVSAGLVGGMLRLQAFARAPETARLQECIDLAFAGKSPAERRRIARRCWVDEQIDGLRQYRLELLSPRELDREIASVQLVGGEHLARAHASGRPIIYVTAHYGAFMLAALKAARAFSSRPLNFFYNPEERNGYAPKSDALIECINASCGILHNDRRGVVAALRCVGRGEDLCIVADQVNAEGEMLFVPFFGRFYAAMPGTAFFAERSDALIVPSFARYRRRGAELEIHPPIDVRTMRAATVADTHFALTCAIFAAFERQLRQAPSPWRYWRSFRALSLSAPKVPVSESDVYAGLAELGARLGHDPELSRELIALGEGGRRENL